MHKDLKDISSDHFPIWNDTMGNDRQFQQPSEFTEEGVLVPTTGEYTYQKQRRRHRRVAPPMQGSSQYSPPPIGQVEFEDNPPPMVLPPSQNENLNYLASCQQTAWSAAQPPEAEPSLPEEHTGVFLEGQNYDQNPEHEEHGYPPSIFMPGMNTMLSSTSAPTQLDLSGPASPYGQTQSPLGHSEPMTSFQPEAQMENSSVGLVPDNTAYDTDIWQ